MSSIRPIKSEISFGIPDQETIRKEVISIRKHELIRIRELFDKYNILARQKNATLMSSSRFIKIDDIMVPTAPTRHNGTEMSMKLGILAGKNLVSRTILGSDMAVDVLLDEMIKANTNYIKNCIKEVENGGGKERECIIL